MERRNTSAITDGSTLFPPGHLRKTLSHAISGVAAGLSLRSARFTPAAFWCFLDEILKKNRYDAIQVEELSLMSALGALPPGLKAIYSAHNVESELSPLMFRHRNLVLGLLAEMERRRTAMEEKNAMARVRACIAVSEKDRDTLQRLTPLGGPPIWVIPNCAHDRFTPSFREREKKRMLSVGAFGWHPNREGILWFMDKVLPCLKRTAPAIKIRIAGSDIGPALRRKMERRGFEVHSDVPDILPFFQEARLLFVPLRVGGGTRIKIVESWAAGLPVVSTSVGAEGLPCRPGEDILIADDPDGFAGAVVRLLEDDALHWKLRSEGLARARSHRWSCVADSLQDLYRHALKDGGTCFQ